MSPVQYRTLTPLGIMKRGLRAALRRRYAYAALRVWRDAVRRALAEHHRASLDPSRPYSVRLDDVRSEYFAGMRRLRMRYRNIDYLDPRGDVPNILGQYHIT